ncbi:MAG TPA: hypothetical protein VI386_05905, partial [Candidatus Sulfotelmatobacter sp.]
DTQESAWEYWQWAENLVRAMEWREFPFQTRTRTVLRWQDHVTVSSNPAAPFQWQSHGQEFTRLVNGRTRLRLGRTLLGQTPPSGAPIERLTQLAELTLFLPNHRDNTAAGGGLEAARQFREQIYNRLDSALTTSLPFDQQIQLLRAMMQLQVAQRSGPALNFNRRIAPFVDSPDMRVAEAARNVLAEKAELEWVLKQGTRPDLEAARSYVDAELKALLPSGWADNPEVLGPRFLYLLKSLDDERVLALLRFRSKLRTVAEGLSMAKAGDPVTVADLHRLDGALELLNSHVWFSRPDFDPASYLNLPRQENQAGARWWPALVVLASYDNTAIARGLEALRHRDKAHDEIATRLQYHVIQLNEAIFATVRAIASQPEAGEILTFQRRFSWSVLNLRILAEAQQTEEASAAGLAANCFLGVLTNNSIAKFQRAPKDEELWQRLFGSLDFLLPEDDRRAESLGVNVDEAISLADVWSRSQRLPDVLRGSARVFLEGRDEGSNELLTGAATPSGVMRAFHEILKRTAAAPERSGYVAFYLHALVTPKNAFSPGFWSALKTPFFKLPASAQCQAVEALLAGWRENRETAKQRSALGGVYRTGFGQVLRRLIRGEDRDESPYIWAPVDALRAERGLRDNAPTEFLAVAKWLLSLQKQYPQSELGALFSVQDGKR